jgi:hypothetical protein
MKVIGFFACIVILGLLFTYPLMLAINYVFTSSVLLALFGIPQMTFWKTFVHVRREGREQDSQGEAEEVMYDTTPPYLRPACMCEFINTGMADGRVPTFRCPVHPGHKAIPGSLLHEFKRRVLRCLLGLGRFVLLSYRR